ncbi:MAG TPA: hypothetical protein VNU65_01870 [Xanthobacteraceae bacterium]|nr:hypothetical protein [Xanthobacteraceae bacterium]
MSGNLFTSVMAGLVPAIHVFFNVKNDQHWPRAWKIRLIYAQNPEWTDLYDTLI